MPPDRPAPPATPDEVVVRTPPDDVVRRAVEVAAADASGQDWPPATLYVIATPIGNRADITVRALACLARVDAVAAEDTRTARTLLHHYGIDRPMIAAHRHNEHEAAAAVVARIANGERVAYVSDAGTPGISDPGARVVATVRDAGYRVVPIPGASALTTALSAAGLNEGAVHFVGFLPNRAAQATVVLETLAALPAHLVFYEAPHRIVDALTAIGKTLPGRGCVIARELTKRFETIHRCATEDAAAWVAADRDRQRGEFVVVVEAEAGDGSARALARGLALVARLAAAMSVADAAALAAEITGVSRKALYAEALRLRRDA